VGRFPGQEATLGEWADRATPFSQGPDRRSKWGIGRAEATTDIHKTPGPIDHDGQVRITDSDVPGQMATMDKSGLLTAPSRARRPRWTAPRSGQHRPGPVGHNDS